MASKNGFVSMKVVEYKEQNGFVFEIFLWRLGLPSLEFHGAPAKGFRAMVLRGKD